MDLPALAADPFEERCTKLIHNLLILTPRADSMTVIMESDSSSWQEAQHIVPVSHFH